VRRVLGGILLWLLLLTVAEGEDGRVEISGRVKTFVLGYQMPEHAEVFGLEPASRHGQVNQVWRGRALLVPSTLLDLEVAYQVAPTLEQGGLATLADGLGPSPSPYRLVDLPNDLLGPGAGGTARVSQDLDRLVASLHLPFADLLLGRQPLAFGSARVLNPTDVLAPFSYRELDREERAGIDALRLRLPLGSLSEVDLGLVAGDHAQLADSAAFARVKASLLGLELVALGTAFQGNLLFGLDCSGELSGAGLWFETAYTLAGTLEEGQDEEDYLRLSLGADYNVALRSGLYLALEYHYNGAGDADPSEALQHRLTSPAYTEGSTYLLGRHYLAAVGRHELVPLWGGSLQVLCNLEDPSASIAPAVDYNVAEEVYLDLGAFLQLGRGLTDQGTWRSEFGAYPVMVYTATRVYF